MPILKKVTKKTKGIDTGYLGIYLPKDLVSYLTLYSLATGRTKTSLIRIVIRNWVDEKMEVVSTKALIKQLAEKSFQAWDNPVGKRENFNTFKTSLKIELKNRKLDDYIDEIIELIDYEKNKNS